MGLLSLGTPLPWLEGKKYADHVRSHGITQFLHIWERLKNRQGDELLWGDEVNTLSLLEQTFLLSFNAFGNDIHRSNTWSSVLTTKREQLVCLFANLKFYKSWLT